MKIATIRTKEFLILESLVYKNTTVTSRYLKNMHENFVIPYVNYLNKFAKQLNEAELSPDQVNQLFQSVAQDVQAGGSNETVIGKMLPDSIKKKFADSLPAANAGEVQGFDQQANTIIKQVQDPATKKGLMNLVKQGIQNPATQKMIIAAAQGIAGVAAGVLTGGLGGALGAGAAGAISGGLIGIVTAKMQGQDWKSAGKAGLAGATVGAVGGLAGNMAAAGAGAALDATTSGTAAPVATTQQPLDIPAELKAGSAAADLKAAQEYAVADQAEKAEIRNITGLSDAQLTQLANTASTAPANAEVPIAKNVETPTASTVAPTPTAEPTVAPTPTASPTASVSADQYIGKTDAFGSTINAVAPDGSWIEEISPKGKSRIMKFPATINGTTVNNASEYLSGVFTESLASPASIANLVDRDLTVRMWALNESLGKRKGGVQLTEAGVKDVVSGVKNWLKTKGQNITQKVTPDKLMQAWTKAGKPTDSEKVYQFLQNQEIPVEIIDRVYSTLKIPTASDATTQPPAAQTGGAFGAMASQLGQTAQATPDAPVTTGRVFKAKSPATPAATPAEPTTTPTAAPATPAATPAAAPTTGTVFDNPAKLLADFNNYIKSGGTISPEVKTALRDALLTKFKIVESKKHKFNRIINEAKRIDLEIKKLKKNKV